MVVHVMFSALPTAYTGLVIGSGCAPGVLSGGLIKGPTFWPHTRTIIRILKTKKAVGTMTETGVKLVEKIYEELVVQLRLRQVYLTTKDSFLLSFHLLRSCME